MQHVFGINPKKLFGFNNTFSICKHARNGARNENKYLPFFALVRQERCHSATKTLSKKLKCSVIQRTASQTNCFNKMKPLIRLQKKLTAGFESVTCQTSVADTVFASESNNAATMMFLRPTIFSLVPNLVANKTRRFRSRYGECESDRIHTSQGTAEQSQYRIFLPDRPAVSLPR